MFHINVEYNKKIVFVRLDGKLTNKNSYKINNYLNPLLQKYHQKYVIYDFKKLKDIDTSGIETIRKSKVIIKKNKGVIILCHVNNKIKNKINDLKIKIINKEYIAKKLCGA